MDTIIEDELNLILIITCHGYNHGGRAQIVFIIIFLLSLVMDTIIEDELKLVLIITCHRYNH
jgi:hypothetical protein